MHNELHNITVGDATKGGFRIGQSEAQAEYVKAWREQYHAAVWGESWPCPLCAQVLQPLKGSIYGLTALTALVERHKADHADDWLAYERLTASAGDAVAGEEQ